MALPGQFLAGSSFRLARTLTTSALELSRILAELRAPTPVSALERRLLSPASMLTWTELGAYLSVIVAVWSGAMTLCYMWLWRG